MEVKTEEQQLTAQLWSHYLETKETEGRDALIVQYLHLVKFAVARIASGLPAYIKLDDLYSSGVTGLIKAVEKFSPEKNNKFETYAVLLIKGAIIDELRELDWIPRSIHRKAQEISTAQNTLQQKLGREPTDEELAKHLGMTEEEFEKALERVRPTILIPLNGVLMSRNEEDETSLADRIPDAKAETSYEAAHRKEFKQLLENAINDLPEQEKRVLILYYYEELMLKEIGKLLGVSESRVSQIHTKAILKLRGTLQLLSPEG